MTVYKSPYGLIELKTNRWRARLSNSEARFLINSPKCARKIYNA